MFYLLDMYTSSDAQYVSAQHFPRSKVSSITRESVINKNMEAMMNVSGHVLFLSLALSSLPMDPKPTQR